MTKIKAIILALRIEYHWWHIKRYRKRFDEMYRSGTDLCSDKIQKLNKRVSRHSTAVMKHERYYVDHYINSAKGTYSSRC